MEVVNADGESTAAASLKHARDEDEDHEYEVNDKRDVEKPRKNGRKRAKNVSSSKPKASDSNDDGQSPGSSGKKKSRMPKHFRKVRGKFGLLETLAKDIPLDVIFEIFCYLDPGDLLRLARTSKDLRGILMSKSSERIWRTAREGVEGLPPRPDDLNEPQYAHLLYEAYCHVCNSKARCDTVLWSFRMRCCKKCALATFPWENDYEYTDNQPFELHSVLPWEEIKGSTRRSRGTTRVGNYEIAARFKAEFEALLTSEDRSAWITRKKQEQSARLIHRSLCEAWYQAKLKGRTDQLQDIRTQRRQDILDRLEKLGWREEAEIVMKQGLWRDEFSDHKLVKQKKKLTAHGWNSIKDELVEMLTNCKRNRLAEERSHILFRRTLLLEQEYRTILGESDLREPFFPDQGDILHNPFFEKLIRDTPLEEDLTQEFFRSKLSEHLPSVVEEWQSAKTQEVVDIMRKTDPTATPSDVRLATNVFQCTRCSSLMQYPQMFYHLCCFIKQDDDWYDEHDGIWSPRFIIWSESDSKTARTLIEASSLDPATTTLWDINVAHPLIECTACELKITDNSWNQGRLFMRWPDALTHLRDHSQHLIIDSFGEDVEKIIASEPKSRHYWAQETIRCIHCNKPQEECNLVSHLKTIHKDTLDINEIEGSSGDQLTKHYYWNPRCSLKALSCGGFRYKSSATN